MKSIKAIIILLFLECFMTIYSQTITSNSPISIDAVLGIEFYVFVSVENVDDLFGVSFILEYDNTYIEAISVENEIFLGEDVVFFPNIDSTNGKVSMGITRKFGQGSVSGTGDLVKITLRVINLPSSNYILNFNLVEITANNDLGNAIFLSPQNSSTEFKIITAIQFKTDMPEISLEFSLNNCYPNPFNPNTRLSYTINESGDISMSIYDLLGNEVTQIENGYKPAGNYSYNFDASNLTSGIYFYRLQAGDYVETKKMLLMK
jgi:Secretion system C-terminal sorting domain/Cohesin domain